MSDINLNSAQSATKKTYHSPNLRVYGDIRELTLAGPSFGTDGPGGYGPNGGNGISLS